MSRGAEQRCTGRACNRRHGSSHPQRLPAGALALAICRFGSAVEEVGETLHPHKLCAYLYDLASAFTSFYEACPVLKADDDATRALRDSVLQASGRLNTKQFGAPIKTPIEPEIYDIIFTEGEPDNLWPLPKDRSEIYRKSIYLLNKRTVRLPMLTNFDQPDAISSCPVRAVSTHALQALSLLNSDFMQEQSKTLAARVDEKCKGNVACQMNTAYAVTLQRPPRPEEQQMARQFLTQKRMPLEDFCKALLNRHEFVYIP